MENSSACPDCGNNPVPHALNWYFESVNVLFTPLRRALIYNRFSKWAVNFTFDRIKLGEIFLKIAIFFKIIRLKSNRLLCENHRAFVLWEEAEKRGINISEMFLFGRSLDAYIAEKDGKKIIFSGLPRPDSSDPELVDIMDDKSILKKQFLSSNIPVANGGCASSFRQALKIFEQIQKPVIVKPRAGSRGRHSNTLIYTEEEFRRAFYIAKQLCFWVMVEEHLFGPVYRGTVINYELCGVLRGDGPFVVGDGLHSIKELVALKNISSDPRVKDIRLNDQTKIFLKRELRHRMKNPEVEVFDYIPASEEVVSLSEKIGLSYGGSSSEDYEICHPDTKELFVKASTVVGDPIVGFDFIIADITKSYKEQRCGFIEANSLPFIDLHHNPLHGQPRNVASHVWEMVGF